MNSKLYYFLLLLFSSCALYDNENISNKDFIEIRHQNGSLIVDEKLVNKIENEIPQNISLFSSQLSEDIAIKVQEKQLELYKNYREQYFSPWLKEDNVKPEQNFYRYLYCENFRILSKKDYDFIKSNVKNAFYINKKAIVVNNTFLKIVPTNSKIFQNIKKPGDSFPFDININSRIRVGLPLRVLAISQDKHWCFVSSCICSGWVNIKDIAYVNDKFVKKYLSCSLGVCVRENTIIDNGNGFINFAEIGTILPLKTGKILCPFKKINGYAGIVLCSRANFQKMPVIFCSSNVRDIAFQFLGQKYGWGGDFESRDCSMLTMDFFSVFGIYISRNSKGQLSNGYIFKQGENKENRLLKAIPWLTIVGKPGHVMLYIGQYNNKPVFLHNIFGFRIMNDSRFVIGKTYLATTSRNEILKNNYYSLLNIISHMKQVVLLANEIKTEK